MKYCDYCGRENEDSLVFCAGCGTILSPPKPQADPPLLAPPFLPFTPAPPRPLSAGLATAVLAVYLAAQFAVGLAASFFSGLLIGLRGGGGDHDQFRETIQAIMPVVMTAAMVLSGIALVWMAITLEFPLRDTSTSGAAWVRGSWRHVAQGLGTGVLVSLFWLVMLFHYGHRPETREELGPLARMSVTSGFPQIAWVTLALLLAPPIEELLFRGILYGGYRKSYGATVAAAVTTCVFVLLHFDELIHQPLATFGIASLALAALWWRLRSNAIGPAIATHFGYNVVVAIAVICGL